MFDDRDAREAFMEPMRAFFGEPPGNDPQAAIQQYLRILSPHVRPVLERAAQQLIDTATKRIWPLPAEVKKTCRTIDAELRGKKPSSDRPWAYRLPRSHCLARDLTKEDARAFVHQDVYPRGSIWVPGSYNPDTKQSGERGDLYGPDPDWQPARQLPSWSQARAR